MNDICEVYPAVVLLGNVSPQEQEEPLVEDITPLLPTYACVECLIFSVALTEYTALASIQLVRHLASELTFKFQVAMIHVGNCDSENGA